MKIISVWESDEQADAAMQRPEFQEAMKEAGVSRDDMQPRQHEVVNIRTS